MSTQNSTPPRRYVILIANLKNQEIHHNWTVFYDFSVWDKILNVLYQESRTFEKVRSDWKYEVSGVPQIVHLLVVVILIANILKTKKLPSFEQYFTIFRSLGQKFWLFKHFVYQESSMCEEVSSNWKCEISGVAEIVHLLAVMWSR